MYGMYQPGDRSWHPVPATEVRSVHRSLMVCLWGRPGYRCPLFYRVDGHIIGLYQALFIGNPRKHLPHLLFHLFGTAGKHFLKTLQFQDRPGHQFSAGQIELRGMHGAGHDRPRQGTPGEPGVLVAAPVPDGIECPVDIYYADLGLTDLDMFHSSGRYLTCCCNLDKTHSSFHFPWILPLLSVLCVAPVAERLVL